MPLLPLHDANPRRYIRAHYATIALVLANVAIFLGQLGTGAPDRFAAVIGYAVVPARLFGDVDLPAGVDGVAPLLTLVSYQFLHGDWMHLALNMLFLWVFGDNVEDALGHARFLGFFVACGIAGGIVHSVVDPTSLTPVIGASGAIAGILAAYLVLYPRARLLVLAFAIIPLRLPALLVIGTYFAQDLLWGLTDSPQAMAIAVWAHIGGAVTGAVLALVLRNWRSTPQGRARL